MSCSGTGASLFPAWLSAHFGGGGSTLLEGLVSYWALDEMSGTRADAVGDNDLTDNNTVGYAVHGPSGTVADVVGANAEYLSSSGASLDLTGNFTYALWYYSRSGGNGALMSNDPAGTRGIACGLDGGAQLLDFWYITDGSNYNHITQSISLGVDGHGAWRLAWFWRDGATMYCTLNNNDSGKASGAIVGTAPYTGDFQIGKHFYQLDGMVGPAGVWDRPLTAQEREDAFNNGTALCYADLPSSLLTGLVSYWNLDEASGTRVDSHGENDLTDNNTVGSATATPGAMHNIAASFMAANSEYFSSSLAFDPSADFSLSWWQQKADGGLTGSALFGCEGACILIQGSASGNPTLMGLSANVYTAGGAATATVSAFDWTAWNHIVANWTWATRTLDVYVNDGSATSGSGSGDAPAASNLTIGKHHGGAYAEGRMDEIGLWSRVLTADERTELYNAGAGKFYPFES